MIDPFLVAKIESNTPKINPDIGRGLAVVQMKGAFAHLDRIIRIAARDFPPGFTYDKLEIVSPERELNAVVVKKPGRRIHDVARKNMRVLSVQMSLHGQPLPERFIQVPFVEDGGLTNINGSYYTVSPVLSDPIVSISEDLVFVRLLKAKLTFERMPFAYFINDPVKIRKTESVQIVHSSIYNKKTPTTGETIKAQCTLMHYLLCKFGYTQTFKQYAGVVPIIGGSEINDTNYPIEEWVIAEGAGNKNRRPGMPVPVVRVAIRRAEYTPALRYFIGGLFYIVEKFATKIDVAYVDDTNMWKRFLGEIIWSPEVAAGRLISDVREHLASLDEYVDPDTQIKLHESGFICSNLYDLFAIIIVEFDTRTLDSDDAAASCYGKVLDVINYVLYDITAGFFKLYFKLKAKGAEITYREAEAAIASTVRTGAAFRLHRTHGEVATHSCSSAVMPFKVTAMMVPQQKSTKSPSRGGDRGADQDPSSLRHATLPVVGQLAGPKSGPNGRHRVSPFLRLTPTGKIIENPEIADLLKRTQDTLTKKMT
jgi:hypothetical protein